MSYGYDENEGMKFENGNENEKFETAAGEQGWIQSDEMQETTEELFEEDTVTANAADSIPEDTEVAKADADSIDADEPTGQFADPVQAQETTQFAQMNLSPEAEKQADTKKKQRKQRVKKQRSGAGFWRSALNGAAFGLCGALVFSGVMVIGNHTFLKKEAPVAIESDKVAGREAKEDESGHGKESREEQADTTRTLPVKSGETSSIASIAKEAMPSIVSITVKGVEEVRGMFGTQRYEATGAGSGIVVDQNDEKFLIATNNHVVEGAEEVSVCFNDSEDAVVPATVVGTDAKNDLAIVSVKKSDIKDEVLSGIKVIAIGSSDSLEVGDQVVAIGNALGYGQSVTTGIVSALDREVQIENLAAKLIQTDAAINPGNSGGALINMKGELVGINSAKFASQTVEGMGYAIPINTAKPILNKLMSRADKDVVEDDEAGFLGVTIQNVTSEASKSYGIPEGAYIGDLEEDGAAKKAGLQKGDVITKFDGIGISGSSDLTEQLAYYKKGDTVEVTYMRMIDGEYKEQTVKVTLEASEAALKARQEREGRSNDADDDADSIGEDGQVPELPDRNDDRAEENGHGEERDSQDGYGSGEYSQEDLEDFFERFFGSGYDSAPEGFQRGY